MRLCFLDIKLGAFNNYVDNKRRELVESPLGQVEEEIRHSTHPIKNTVRLAFKAIFVVPYTIGLMRMFQIS